MRFKPYSLSFRGKNAVFPLTSGRAALCRRLAFSPFSKVKRSNISIYFIEKKLAAWPVPPLKKRVGGRMG
ncbi:hypothetical protein, partial [uncultured Desulfovibrio sp.]|uniref:hypothetical protein n=1 Tax=uncultured Desulfovibrio sp. TaxID=167968 RepID=UPI0026222F25